MINSFTAKFCDSSDHFARFYVVDDAEEAKSTLFGWEDDMDGLCHYDHDQQGEKVCMIVLLRSKLSVGLVVHECTHAAIEWVSAVSSSRLQIRTPSTLSQPWASEAAARVNESLVTGFLAKHPL